MNEAFEILRFDGGEVRRRIEEFGGILVDCVEGGASVSFMPPFSQADGAAFWCRLRMTATRAGGS